MINSSKTIILHLASCFEPAVYAMIYVSLQAISKVSMVHGKSLFDVLDVSLMLWSILGLHSLSNTVDEGFYLPAHHIMGAHDSNGMAGSTDDMVIIIVSINHSSLWYLPND